jgi:hypothetical protein
MLDIPTSRLTIHSSASSTSVLSLSGLPETIEISSVEFRAVKPVPNKRGKTSWIWKHGYRLENVLRPAEGPRWMCHLCHADGNKVITYAITTTTHASRHLEKNHQLSEENRDPSRASSRTPSEAALESRGIQDSIDFPQFQKDVTDWITDMHISLSQFQFKRLRKIFISLNRSVAPHIPTSGNTIRNWIMAAFEKKRDEVKSQLALSRSEIHFSFDLWTSPNHLSIVGIIAHYFSSSGKAKDCLLGLKRVCGTHSGENMAQCIVPVLEHYELKNRIGYFVLDNISSNDLCVRAILQRLRPDLDPKTRRLRCFGHVVNLAAKAFLFGNSKGRDSDDSDSEDTDTRASHAQQLLDKDIKTWRKSGPLGKLQKVVKYIRGSPQRIEAFRELLTNKKMAKKAESKYYNTRPTFTTR